MARPRGLPKATPLIIGNRRVRSCGSMVYVRISPLCFLPLLIFSSMVSWIGKKCALVCVTTRLYSLLSALSHYLIVQQSSKRSGTCVKLDWPLSHFFTLISVILPSRMSAACYLPSLSNSPISPTISAQSSLNSIQPTNMDLNNPAKMHLRDA
jgi:hypothetical protein